MIASRAIPNEELAWMAGVLWDGRRGAGGRASHYVIPGRGRPRVLVPRERAVATASLLSHNRLRPIGTRMLRWGAAMAIRSGMAPIVFPQVGDPVGFSADLVGRLADALGAGRLAWSAGVPARTPFRKPVLQLVDPRGRIVGFAKVGAEPVARALVENEGEILRRVAELAPRTFAAPEILYRGEVQGASVLVTAPLPPSARRARSIRSLDPLRELAGLHSEVVSSPLSETAGWADLRRRLERIGAPAAAAAAAADELHRRAASLEVLVGTWHGDWVPWNLAEADGRLHVIDWEHAEPGQVLGLDLVHHAFQRAFIGKGSSLRDSLRARRVAADGVVLLGQGPGSLEVLLAIHTLKIFIRMEEARLLGAPTNPRFHPQILHALRELAR